MTTETMTSERLEAIVAVYGADPARWPAAERDAAASLLARSDAARALTAHAAALDAALDAVPSLSPTPALRAAVLAAAPQARPPSLLTRLRESWRAMRDEFGNVPAMGSLFAASLVLGVIAGGILAGSPAAESDPDLMQLALYYDESDAEF
ncbi:MAG: hypothetical protein AB7S71_20395 [Dongiaceae bacterium]